jgi:hypothetical protein
MVLSRWFGRKSSGLPLSHKNPPTPSSPSKNSRSSEERQSCQASDSHSSSPNPSPERSQKLKVNLEDDTKHDVNLVGRIVPASFQHPPSIASEAKTDPDNSPQVTWESENDPRNPLNWSNARKWMATLIISSFTFISPVSSTMVSPALPTVSDQFGVTNKTEEALMMSIFLLAYAIGPFFIGPLSEIFGRVSVMQLANLEFLIFNTACGFAQSKQQMLAFRFLSGLGGSAPQAVRFSSPIECDSSNEP